MQTWMVKITGHRRARGAEKRKEILSVRIWPEILKVLVF